MRIGLRLGLSILCTASLLFAAGPRDAYAAERTIIHAGWLLAVPGEAPVRAQSIIVEDGRVLAVRDGYVKPAAQEDGETPARVVDLRDGYVLPGLIDLHVHLTSPVKPGGDLRVVTHDPADLALIAARHARITLDAGVTTVLDLGTGRRAHEAAIYALRKAVAQNTVPGPRILAVGSPISATGSARTGRYRDGVEEIVGPEAECDGPADCRRAVREQVARGADVISFYNTGSLMDDRVAPMAMTAAEMRAVVETAHALGRPAYADGHNAEGVNAAIRAGANALVSATWPDEETWSLLEGRDVFYISHVYAFEAAIGDAPDALSEGTMGYIASPVLRRLYEIKQNPYAAMMAYEKGVPMALGSDTGVIHHGENAKDLIEFVKRGMTPMEALEISTINGARALWMEDDIGSIEPGKFADIIALASDPLADIGAVLDVIFVMKGGRVHTAP